MALIPLLLVLVQFFGSPTRAEWWCALLGRLSSFSCFLTVSADIWSLNYKTTRILAIWELPSVEMTYIILLTGLNSPDLKGNVRVECPPRLPPPPPPLTRFLEDKTKPGLDKKKINVCTSCVTFKNIKALNFMLIEAELLVVPSRKKLRFGKKLCKLMKFIQSKSCCPYLGDDVAWERAQ